MLSPSPSPGLSPGPINFYFERKPKPGNEPEPGAEPRIELGIEPKPEVEPEPEPGVEPEPGLYLLSRKSLPVFPIGTRFKILCVDF